MIAFKTSSSGYYGNIFKINTFIEAYGYTMCNCLRLIGFISEYNFETLVIKL